MKRTTILKTILLAAVVGMLTFLSVYSTADTIVERGTEMCLYPTTGRVVTIRNDEVIFETATGIQYAFSGAEDYEVNDIVSVIMDSMGTETIFDDKIVRARYSGFTWNEMK